MNKKPRISHFTDEEVYAIACALRDFVSVYCVGKWWDELSKQALALHQEFATEADKIDSDPKRPVERV